MWIWFTVGSMIYGRKSVGVNGLRYVPATADRIRSLQLVCNGSVRSRECMNDWRD